ncbi:alpha-1,6-mannosyl-glycoprotein 2-beta-N-acetylglucosaminyltransferase-like [Sycon ciliatum]|uniref:alpha-1,6-mannosyl-glycoprotein 2-beta-N-acetylglucosaminyltransferase-like n=1 Tax=Sycon ciliatum TaxID=27933 RepID=UPI0031F608D7
MHGRCPVLTKSSWRLVLVSMLATQVVGFLLMVGFSPRPDIESSVYVKAEFPAIQPHPDHLSMTSASSHASSAKDLFRESNFPPGSVARGPSADIPQVLAGEALDDAVIALYKQRVSERNRRLVILNEAKFGAVSPSDVVIVVQVHRRVRELELFLSGLAKARGVESSLLIVSMDYITPGLENIIGNITFCRVLPIYFPHSIQLHPREFPGTDPHDCKPSLSRQEAEVAGCGNAGNPDSYGHYRDAGITATKHHWWWKCAFVFDRIPALHNHTGFKLFVEEDHYLAPDFLHVLNLMEKSSIEDKRNVDFFSLGRQRKKLGKGDRVRFSKISNGDFSQFEAGMWNSAVYNMGFAFKRTVWTTVKSCAQVFCTYDDYNWDWTLFHLGKSCRNTPFEVMAALAPRVYHFGMCGVHFKMKNCNPADALTEYIQFLDGNRYKQFPTGITSIVPVARMRRNVKPFGGWGDRRDVQQCMSFIGS